MISAVIRHKDGTMNIHNSPVDKVGETFPPGYYKCNEDRNGNTSIKAEDLTELHQPFNTEEVNHLFKCVAGFFKDNSQRMVNSLGFTHKLGLLLSGEAGTGKTSIMNYIASQMIESQGAIVFFCDDNNSFFTAIEVAASIRKIQNSPIVFVADEFDRYVEGSSEKEAHVKDFLDGKLSIDNSLVLAATNYLDRIPNSIKNRPSRFRYTVEIKGIQTKEDVEAVVDVILGELDKKDKRKDLKKEIMTNFVSFPVTMDQIKSHVLNEVLSVNLPKISQKSIGFASAKDERSERTTMKRSGSLADLIGGAMIMGLKDMD